MVVVGRKPRQSRRSPASDIRGVLFDHSHEAKDQQALSRSSLDASATSDAVSEDESAVPSSSPGGVSRSSSHTSTGGRCHNHIVRLSGIEQCMPRAYIRICYAYRIPTGHNIDTTIDKLKYFVRRAVDAKPYLAGFVTEPEIKRGKARQAEIRFTTQDFLNYPEIDVRVLCNTDGTEITFDELDRQSLPPSRIKPEEVAKLAPDVDNEQRAPAFRVQANIVKGGLIVSFYLHHCISDGHGFDLLARGQVCHCDFVFDRHADAAKLAVCDLDQKLHAFAGESSCARKHLSCYPQDSTQTRQLVARRLDTPQPAKNKPGRGCILNIRRDKIQELLSQSGNSAMTQVSLLMALLWRHMTRARRQNAEVNAKLTSTKLLIPVDIRRRLDKPLPECYFGSAVDFAKAELTFDKLNGMSLAEVSGVIKIATKEVNEPYIRQAIAFAATADANTDVHDLQASNMNRVTGADMYITSWLKLKSYTSDLGMGIGFPAWIRKPWSRDPGSCIILPLRPGTPDYYEVVVQMTVADMSRLLDDEEFTEFVDLDKIID